ncbi:MAG: TonB-dependent receptor [Daejeonella sp.]
MKRKNFYVAAGLGLVQLILLNSKASAQEKPLRTLDEVVVTASRSPKKQSEIGKVVMIISAETLARSQGRSLTEVLNNVSGLTIGGSGNNQGDVKAIYLRGSSPGNTLILMDGIPVNDASGISGEYNISAIPVDQVERVEILKGGNSTLYGSDAVAGVINIITKKGLGKLRANLLATGGSKHTFKQVLGLNGQIEKTAVAFNASNLETKGFSTATAAKGETDFDRDGFKQRSVSLNISEQATDKFLIRGNVQANDNKADLDGGSFADAKDYTYAKTSFLAGFGGVLNLNTGALNFNVSQNNVKNLFNYAGSLTNNVGRITHVETGLNYSLSSFLDITSGASYKYSATDQNSPYENLIANNKIKSVFTSLFFKTDHGFRAEIGGRYNDHSQFGDNFTYTLNPSYVFNDRYKVFVNVSSAYRVPSLYQLFSVYGNLNLKPETTTSYEAGFDLDISEILNLNFSYFKRKTKDVIAFGQVTPDKFGYLNQDKQNDKGFELELGVKPTSNINISGFFAYVDGNITTPTNTSFNLFRRPKNSFGANAAIELSKKTSFNLIYKFTDKRKDQYFDGTSFETVEADLAAYHLFDIYLQYKPINKLTLFADVKNILDKKYIEFAGYNTQGINFNAGFKLGLY